MIRTIFFVVNLVLNCYVAMFPFYILFVYKVKYIILTLFTLKLFLEIIERDITEPTLSILAFKYPLFKFFT